MFRSEIIIMILITFLNFGGTYETNFDKCVNKKILNKCCPIRQFVIDNSYCGYHKEVFNLSAVTVYTDNLEDTGCMAQTFFNISPSKFDDEVFFEESINLNGIGYNVYLTENGELIISVPNQPNLWDTIQNGNFCVDFSLENDNIELAFWGLLEDMEETEDVEYIYITTATLVSCGFLLLCLIVYILLPELQNLGGKILMAYMASLFMGFLLLATIRLSFYTVPVCKALTSGIYFFLLSSFCWMSVMSCDIWWTFRGYAKTRPIHRRGENFKFRMYCLYAWGVPFSMTIGMITLNEIDMSNYPGIITPQIPLLGCFLEGEAKRVYLYIPMLILIICNWMFYLMTAFNIWRINQATMILDSAAAGTPAVHRTQRHRFVLYVKLSVVMGLNWVLEIISFEYQEYQIWKISDSFNIFIGFSIFLIFVCKKKILRMLCKRFKSIQSARKKLGSSSASSRSSGVTQETTALQVCNDPKGCTGYVIPMKTLYRTEQTF